MCAILGAQKLGLAMWLVLGNRVYFWYDKSLSLTLYIYNIYMYIRSKYIKIVFC